mgnify:CR=1 FL=1
MNNHPRIAAIADIGEKLLLICFFLFALVRLGPGLTNKPFNMLFLLSELIPVVLVLLRKPGAIVLKPHVMLVAFLGTGMALLCGDGVVIGPPAVAVPLMFAGLCFSLTAKLFLNTSFGFLAANRGVKQAGPYQLVRHPIYAGYILTQIGFLMMNFSGWNVLVLSLTWLFQILRIMTEEEVLGADPAYASYRDHVRYRLVPGLF